MAAKVIKKNARENGVAEKTLYRAKATLRVKSEKEVYGWTWMLPEDPQRLLQAPKVAKPPGMTTLTTLAKTVVRKPLTYRKMVKMANG